MAVCIRVLRQLTRCCRLSLKIIMKLKIGQLSLFSAILLVFSAIPYKNILAETSIGRESYQIAYEYPKNFQESYLSDCVEVASEHLETEDAQKICECTLNKFQSDYNYDEYKKLSPELKQDVGLVCFEEMPSEEE